MKTEALAVIEPKPLASQLAGFEDLYANVAIHLDAQKQLFVKVTCHGLEIGRLINEFAARKELRAEVDRINKATRDEGKGGRPKAYPCYVAQLLADSGLGMTKEWLEKCARAFERAKLLNFKVQSVNLLSSHKRENETVTKLPIAGNATLHTPVLKDDSHFPQPIETTLPAPDRVFPAPPEEKEPAPKLTFKEFTKEFIGKLDGLVAKAGEVGIRSKRNQEALADSLTEWFAAQGVTIDITFN